MAYPTDSLAKVLDEVDSIMIRVKQYSSSISSQLSSGSVDAPSIMQIRYQMKQSLARLATLKTTPGLADYARTEKNDATLDVVAAFNGVETTMQAVVTEIESTFPKDAQGYLLRDQWDPTGPDTIPRSFPSSALVPLKTKVDAVVAAID